MGFTPAPVLAPIPASLNLPLCSCRGRGQNNQGLCMRVPPGGNKSAKVNGLFKATGGYSCGGTSDGNYAVDNIKTGIADVFEDVSLDPVKNSHLATQCLSSPSYRMATRIPS